MTSTLFAHMFCYLAFTGGPSEGNPVRLDEHQVRKAFQTPVPQKKDDKDADDNDVGSVLGAILAGDGPKAERYATRELARARKSKNDAGIAGSLNLLGMAQHFRGNTAGAERSWAESATVYRKLSDDFNVYRTLANLANAYADLGLFADAEFVLQRCLAYQKRQNDDESCVDILQNLGHLSFGAGDTKKAEDYYQRANMMIKKSETKRPGDIGYALWLLGCNHLEAKDPKKAREAFNAALRFDPTLKRKITGMEGYLLLSEGRFKRAEAVIREGLKQTDPTKNAWEYSNYQETMGLILLQKRDLNKAKDCLADCIRIRRVQYSPSHPIVAHALENLARVYRAGRELSTSGNNNPASSGNQKIVPSQAKNRILGRDSRKVIGNTKAHRFRLSEVHSCQ